MKCKHCGKEITHSDGKWVSGTSDVAQYCWIDPVQGSQLHEPVVSVKKEIWLYALVGGEEFARIYIAQYGREDELEHDLDVYQRNGCSRHDALRSVSPYGTSFEYRIHEPKVKAGPFIMTESVDE